VVVIEITKDMIFGQFGQLYSSFTGNLAVVNFNDVKSTGVNFVSDKRTNPFSAIANDFPKGYLVPANYSYGISVSPSQADSAATVSIYQSETYLAQDEVNSRGTLIYSGSAGLTNQRCANISTRYFYFQYKNSYGDLSKMSDPIAAKCLDAGGFNSQNYPAVQLRLSEMTSTSIPITIFSTTSDISYVIKIGSPGSSAIKTEVIKIPAIRTLVGGVYTTTFTLNQLRAGTSYSLSVAPINSQETVNDSLFSLEFTFVTKS
jgi:hypothetical protein